eukprot:gnl/Dysnectes_brevis/2949_a3627_881.p1 GENE.gnl/Dysnectes_brevis/2949_a3627_881~~gnl/Dysnectes_brevis/2949_a3627_881.p1  ORF type:complete len:267 (+),score=72.63 gnl/Dysnectes_brevis/2949_a3627_881:14-814(+)
MGGATISTAKQSTTRDYICAEFLKARPDPATNTVTITQLLSMKQLESARLDFTHLGLLYCIDSNQDGRFELVDLLNLAVFHSQVEKAFSIAESEVPAHLMASCAAILATSLDTGEGSSSFINWYISLISAVNPPIQFDFLPGVKFFPSQGVRLIHALLAIERTAGLGLPSFQQTLQQAGEQLGVLPLNRPELDSCVPVLAIQRFMSAYLEGYHALYSTLGVGVSPPPFPRPFTPRSPLLLSSLQAAQREEGLEVGVSDSSSDSDGM